MSTTDRPEPGRSQSASSNVGEELSNDAHRLADTAKGRAQQEAESRKGEAARTVRSASSALDRAASELEQDQNAPSWLASAVKQTAGQIDRLAGEVEGRDVQEIGRQVTSFARQNPGTFLAASAAAGFAAARFLRAGSEYQSHHQGGNGHGMSAATPRTSVTGAPSTTTSVPSATTTVPNTTSGGDIMGSSTSGATSTTGATTSRPATGTKAPRVEPPVRQGGPTT